MLASLYRFLWWLSYQFNPIYGFIFGALLSLFIPLDDGFIATMWGNIIRAGVLGLMGAFVFMFINDAIFDAILAGVIGAPK